MKQTLTKSAARTQGGNADAEPVTLLKRIGSTTYKVTVRFSEKATETMEEKLLRLMEREVSRNA